MRCVYCRYKTDDKPNILISILEPRKFSGCSFLFLFSFAMQKMKLFKKLKEYLMWVRILPRDKSSKETFLSVGINCFCFGLLVCACISTIWYSSMNRTTSEYVRGVFYSICNVFFLFWYIVFIWNKTNYENLSIEFAVIIGKSKMKFIYW